MLTIIFLFLLAFVIVLTIWWYIIYFKYQRYLGKFPGRYVLPIVGSLHHIRLGKNLLPSITKVATSDNYKQPERFMIGFYPGLATADAKTTEFLLGSKTILKKSLEYKYFDSWLGSGLLTSDGPKWKKHRKLLTPAFHFQILEQFIQVFENQSDILIKKLEGHISAEVDVFPYMTLHALDVICGPKWKKHRKLLTPAFHFQILEQFIQVFENQSDILIKKLEGHRNAEVDVFPYMTLHALDVICEATMNSPINAQLDPNSDFVKSVKDMCNIFIRRFTGIKMFNIVYMFSKDYHKEKTALNVLHGLSNAVIKTRREELQTQKLGNLSDENHLGTKKRVAFLDVLLTSTVDGVFLTNEEIRDEVNTFMFAGHDTTTSALSFTVYTLSKYPKIQDKVFQEISDVLGNDETAEFTYENLQKLKYLEQVIKEVLRFYPPVPMFSRITTEDVTYDGAIIPKGVIMIVFVYHLHHNPELYEYPEMFDPERFNPENSKNISLYSYIPFSAGSRNCIGQRFAMLEIKTTISKILQKFKVLPVLGHKPILLANAILTSENGLPVRLEKRK